MHFENPDVAHSYFIFQYVTNQNWLIVMHSPLKPVKRRTTKERNIIYSLQAFLNSISNEASSKVSCLMEVKADIDQSPCSLVGPSSGKQEKRKQNKNILRYHLIVRLRDTIKNVLLKLKKIYKDRFLQINSL